jgi:hypothetical protein
MTPPGKVAPIKEKKIKIYEMNFDFLFLLTVWIGLPCENLKQPSRWYMAFTSCRHRW